MEQSVSETSEHKIQTPGNRTKERIRLSEHSEGLKSSLWLFSVNPLNPELNPICYLLPLLAHHFLHVRRIMVKSLPLRLLMSYIYIYIYIYIHIYIWSAYS